MSGQWGNPFDGAVLDFALSIRSDALTAVVRGITTVGNTVSLIAIATIGVLVLLRLGHRGWAGFCGLTSLIAWGLMAAIKEVFDRERPLIPPRLVEIDSASFPSGHALNSMVVLGCLAVAAFAITGRRWPIALALIGSGLIGLSRVYLAAHWMTDVLAGWAFGAAIVAVALWIRRDRAARRGLPAPPPAAAR